jgi:hypothetical protein
MCQHRLVAVDKENWEEIDSETISWTAGDWPAADKALRKRLAARVSAEPSLAERILIGGWDCGGPWFNWEPLEVADV